MKQFKVYQLPVEHSAKFMDLEFVTEYHIMPKLEDYKLVYEGEFEPQGEYSEPDQIYMKFQGEKPEGYTGHSISMSDVVEIDGKYFYCDSFGWENVTELFPKPTLKKGEKYECIKDYVMEDGSIAYKAGKTYEMLSDILLGIDEGGSELHKMSDERDFYLYFKKVVKECEITCIPSLIHFAKNGDLLHGNIKIGTYYKEVIGGHDASGNKLVPFMYWVEITSMPHPRGARGFYSRKEVKEWLDNKKVKVSLQYA